MLTSILLEAAQKNRLIIIEGAICRFTRQKDGAIKITDILSIKKGAGIVLINMIKTMRPTYICASCPADWAL